MSARPAGARIRRPRPPSISAPARIKFASSRKPVVGPGKTYRRRVENSSAFSRFVSFVMGDSRNRINPPRIRHTCPVRTSVAAAAAARGERPRKNAIYYAGRSLSAIRLASGIPRSRDTGDAVRACTSYVRCAGTKDATVEPLFITGTKRARRERGEKYARTENVKSPKRNNL